MWNSKRTLLEELPCLEVVEEVRILSDVERVRKTQVTMDLERVILIEEISTKQKSRALRLKEVDMCTKFFHHVANSPRNNSIIETMVVGGAVSSNLPEIIDHIVQY